MRHCHVNCDGYTEVMSQIIEYYVYLWLVPKGALVYLHNFSWASTSLGGL